MQILVMLKARPHRLASKYQAQTFYRLLRIAVISFLFMVSISYFFMYKCHAMGDTVDTIESIAYKYANDPRGLYEYAKRFKIIRSHRVKQPKQLLRSNSGQCTDLALFYKEILDRGIYENEMVYIEKEGAYNDHIVNVVREHGGLIVISNNMFIRTNCKKISELREYFPNAVDIYIWKPVGVAW